MTWATNHNKAAVRGLSVSQSQHISAILVGSWRWLHLRRLVAPLWWSVPMNCIRTSFPPMSINA